MKKTLIFDLGGGFNDMIKTLICIIEFTSKYNFDFTIRYCTARPQNHQKPVPDCISKNKYKYDVINLFDERTFLIYKNYISYNDIKNSLAEDDTYDFYQDKIHDVLFKDNKKDELDIISNNLVTIFNDCFPKHIIVGGGFCFYANCCNINIWKTQTLEFYKTLIPNKKIVDEYLLLSSTIEKPYNFIHYRHEEDMRSLAVKMCGKFDVPTLDVIIDANLFKNNSHKIYIATSCIETLHKRGLLNNELCKYENLHYKTSRLDYFDENAWLDFMIGLESEEVCGFKYSGFSVTLNKFKNTSNYYNDRVLAKDLL